MHPDIADLVENIDVPFASTISSIISTKASYFGDKLFLAGDALAQVQPNIGQGTNMAARAALMLGEVFAGKLTVDQFETGFLQEVRDVNNRAIALGTSFMGEPQVKGS